MQRIPEANRHYFQNRYTSFDDEERKEKRMSYESVHYHPSRRAIVTVCYFTVLTVRYLLVIYIYTDRRMIDFI